MTLDDVDMMERARLAVAAPPNTWAPFVNRQQAFELMVMLGLSVEVSRTPFGDMTIVRYEGHEGKPERVIQCHETEMGGSGDPFLSTCRAIVTAASNFPPKIV